MLPFQRSPLFVVILFVVTILFTMIFVKYPDRSNYPNKYKLTGGIIPRTQFNHKDLLLWLKYIIGYYALGIIIMIPFMVFDGQLVELGDIFNPGFLVISSLWPITILGLFKF
jgi:hypothetical protein